MSNINSSNKTYFTGFIRYPFRAHKDRLSVKEITHGTEVDIVCATPEVDFVTSTYINITKSDIAVAAIAQASFDGPTGLDSTSYREHLAVVSETLAQHAPTVILDHDARPLSFSRAYLPRITPYWYPTASSERIKIAPPIIFNHNLIRIYLETAASLGPEHEKSLGLYTIIVVTFFHELVHYMRSMVGLEPTPELRQGLYNPKVEVQEMNREELPASKAEGGSNTQTEIFGQLTSYIKEGGASFNDLVGLSFTTRDNRQHYFALSAEDIPFLQRFTRVEWAAVREDLEIFGSRQRSFGPAFPAHSAPGPEPVRPSSFAGVVVKLPPTEAEHLEQAAAIIGQPVKILYGGETGW